ncbi:hypothetical protein DFP73DRAFT_590340 [Morchella snyderi]|nr:hypothetical protein DFP73DRAFT_590340 [Morchella snyderi]
MLRGVCRRRRRTSANSGIPQGAEPTPWAPGTPGAARAEALAPPEHSLQASAPSDITYIYRAPSNALSAIISESRRITHLHASGTSGNVVLVLRAPVDALSAMARWGDSTSALTALATNICARRSNHNELLARRCQNISLTPREHSSVLSAPGEHSHPAACQTPQEHIAHAKTLFVNKSCGTIFDNTIQGGTSPT